jgi:hypothetical protein
VNQNGQTAQRANSNRETNEERDNRIASVVRELAASGLKFINHPAFVKEVAQRAHADERDIDRVVRHLILAGELSAASVGLE